jgi:hypothetical protein
MVDAKGTVFAGIRCTSWPDAFSSRAQWCAVAHLPMRQAGSLAKNDVTSLPLSLISPNLVWYGARDLQDHRQIGNVEQQIVAWCRNDVASRRLATIPGVRLNSARIL